MKDIILYIRRYRENKNLDIIFHSPGLCDIFKHGFTLAKQFIPVKKIIAFEDGKLYLIIIKHTPTGEIDIRLSYTEGLEIDLFQQGYSLGSEPGVEIVGEKHPNYKAYLDEYQTTQEKRRDDRAKTAT